MVERTLREGRSQPQMSNDVDLMRAEAVMWLDRRDTDKAGEVVQQALKTAPNNTELFRTYCDILLQARDYRRLLALTDPMVKAKTAPWWVYQYRGRADTALKDNQQALIEFTNGMDVASAAKDDAALASILDTIVKEIGVPSAISRVIGLAEKGDNRWRLMMSSLLQTDNDTLGAIDWVQKVINDSSADSTTRATAQQRLAQLYLRLTPPECGKAVAVYRDLLKNDPNDLVALNNLACTMILPNSGYQPKEALTYSEQAFKQVQQSGDVNAYIYDTQGYVLVLTGRVQDGITLLRQAIDKEPIPEACYHLGEAYLTLPQPLYSEAEESLKQALGVLDALSKDQKPLDAELKTKIEQALARAHPPGGTTPEAAKQEAAKS
jgi:tetratricopeptide (TPR) repeat protein